jgi:hypothetical protein
MHGIRSLLSAIVAALSLGACAVDVGHPYDAMTADIRVNAPQIALGVHDQRPYVVDGQKVEHFVGLTRGGYNNPWDAFTASRKPLADEIAKSLADSLRRNGSTVTIVRLEPKMSREDARLTAAKSAPKAAILTLLEWKTDIGYSYRHNAELELHIVNASGRVVGESRFAENRTFRYDMTILPTTVFKREIPPVFKQYMEYLFSQPSVNAASL